MKYIKKFDEALKPSQFRNYVNAFDRERYLDIFKKMGEVYDHDKNFYRIYIPLEKSKVKKDFVSEVHKKIDKFLSDNDCQIVDYVKGTAKFNSAKNVTTIGKILVRLKNDALNREFVSDEKRKNFVADRSNDLMVVISRHPYDIAGSDTDRNWTNCMTIGTDKSNRILNMIDRLGKMSKNDPGYNSLKSKIDNYKENGVNVKYLIKEVTEGSIISYLIKYDDRDIKNPIGVLNIKPYDKDGEEYLWPSAHMYGVNIPNFRETIMDIVKEFFNRGVALEYRDRWNNNHEKGIFTIKKGLYSDGIETFNLKPSADKNFTKEECINWLNENYGDLERVETEEYIYYVDSDRKPVFYFINPKYNKIIKTIHGTDAQPNTCHINSDIWDFFKNVNILVKSEYDPWSGVHVQKLDELEKMLIEWVNKKYHISMVRANAGGYYNTNKKIWNTPL